MSGSTSEGRDHLSPQVVPATLRARIARDETLTGRTFEQSVAVERVRRVAVPAAVLHPQQSELLRHLSRRHGCADTDVHTNQHQMHKGRTLSSRSGSSERTIRQVLLVGEHQQQAVLHLAVVQDLVQLGPRLVDAVSVLRVDDKDETLRARVVVSPERPDFVLSTDVLREGGVSDERATG